jgi:general secretion pathway protein M
MNALANLSPRERALVLVVLPLALLFAAYQFAWLPLNDLRGAREAEIAGYRLVVQTASEAGTAPAAPESPDAAPLAARVTQSAEAAGLSLSRLEPEGDRLRVLVAEATFAQVVLWISDLEAEEDVTLAAIELDRRTAPGAVSARLLLEPAR